MKEGENKKEVEGEKERRCDNNVQQQTGKQEADVDVFVSISSPSHSFLFFLSIVILSNSFVIDDQSPGSLRSHKVLRSIEFIVIHKNDDDLDVGRSPDPLTS